MSHPLPRSIPSALRGVAVMVACLVTVAVASPADAGLGGLVKKAKDKAAQAVDKKDGSPAEATPSRPPGKIEFGDIMVELTEERVSRIVAAIEASSAISAGRPALVAKVEKLMQERNALEDKQGDAMRALRNQRDDVHGCLQAGYQQAQDRRASEYAQKAMTADPAMREKLSRAAQEYNAAAARGDTTAQRKLNEVVLSAMLPTREDSAAVENKCGPVPPPSPAEAQASALEKQITGTEEQIRDTDKKAADAASKKAGLREGQYAMALERIKMYLAWRQSHDPGGSGKSGGSGGSGGSSSSSGSGGSESTVKIASPVHGGFTAEEIEALEKYLERLRAAHLE